MATNGFPGPRATMSSGTGAGSPVDLSMIGVLIVAHDTLGDSLIEAVSHVLGGRPQQFEAFSVQATDDPLALLPRARSAVQALDTGDGVLVFSDIFGATPCNLAVKLLQPGRVEGITGVMMLAAGKGSKVMLEIDGPDEAQAMEAICTLIGDNFGEGE